MSDSYDTIISDIATLEKQIRNKKYDLYKLAQPAEKKEDRLVLRQKMRKLKYATINGLSVHNLRQAGCKVKITHVRYSAQEGVAAFVPVPTYLRKFVSFHPRGGVTYMVITTPDGQTIAYNSICHINDCFDYKLGVALCLNQIKKEEAAYLLSGIKQKASTESPTQIESVLV